MFCKGILNIGLRYDVSFDSRNLIELIAQDLVHPIICVAGEAKEGEGLRWAIAKLKRGGKEIHGLTKPNAWTDANKGREGVWVISTEKRWADVGGLDIRSPGGTNVDGQKFPAMFGNDDQFIETTASDWYGVVKAVRPVEMRK